MRKTFTVLCAAVFLFLLSCSKTEKLTVIKEAPVPSANVPFGPFFLPENSSLSSVSLNYVTGEPKNTTVYFTMVGEMDWARNDPSLTRYHSMVFKDLEESAVYQFTIPGVEKDINPSSVIQTVPYGNDYQFQFVIASMERELDNNLKPNFLVLGSDREKVSERDLSDFYSRNRKLLSSTILIPMFALDIPRLGGGNFDLTEANNGFHFVRYKNLCLLLVNREMPDYDFLTRYFSNAVDDQNIIVLSRVGKKTVAELSRRFALMNIRIYVLDRDRYSDQNLENVIPVETALAVNIIKKPTLAMVVTNQYR